MKALVGAFNQEKALESRWGLLRDCTTSPINRFAALVFMVAGPAAVWVAVASSGYITRSDLCSSHRRHGHIIFGRDEWGLASDFSASFRSGCGEESYCCDLMLSVKSLVLVIITYWNIGEY